MMRSSQNLSSACRACLSEAFSVKRSQHERLLRCADTIASMYDSTGSTSLEYTLRCVREDISLKEM